MFYINQAKTHDQEFHQGVNVLYHHIIELKDHIPWLIMPSLSVKVNK